jgi:hypothetical protein
LSVATFVASTVEIHSSAHKEHEMTLGAILADSFPQEGRRIGLIDNGETGLTVKVREMVERNAIALAGRKGVHEGVKQPLTNSVSLKARIDCIPRSMRTPSSFVRRTNPTTRPSNVATYTTSAGAMPP